jgi:hypothetical protein
VNRADELFEHCTLAAAARQFHHAPPPRKIRGPVHNTTLSLANTPASTAGQWRMRQAPFPPDAGDPNAPMRTAVLA